MKKCVTKIEADLVIINGKVITVDKDFSIQQAVAVIDDRIVAVGTNDDIKGFIASKTMVLDLNGKPLLPGINDTHLHAAVFGGTRPPFALDLKYPNVKSIRDMADVIRKKIEAVRPGEWIEGRGWDTGFLKECKDDPSKMPTKWDIDPVSPDNPVAFVDFSGHTLLVNSKAMQLAGITKDSPDPEGGEIERDPTNGQPTGILKELSARALVSKIMPLYSREHKKKAILWAMQDLNTNGITSFTEASLGPGGDSAAGGLWGTECIDIYKELHDERKLTARVTILLLLGEYGALKFVDLKKGLETFKKPSDLNKIWLQIPGVKIFADGIPTTKTSWMHDQYIGGGHGALVTSGETDEDKYSELANMVFQAHRRGFQVAVHATGDRAIDAVVDSFVKAVQEKPGENQRHYVIHGDFISSESARLLAENSLGVTMQPEIKTLIADVEDSVVGKKRSAYEWPMRTVLDAGVNLAGSSDAPVTYPNWRKGVQSAVLREAKGSGRVSGPDQCITVAEAIRMYTINGAWLDHMEKAKGSVEVGKLADFCILGEDILNIDPHEIGEVPVLMTIVGGKIVHDDSRGILS
ncbi:MAG: amidohydrolase [bacterium]|nr:amidohydrolase [bacterium]